MLKERPGSGPASNGASAWAIESVERVRLLDADPELAAGVVEEELGEARRLVIAPAVRLNPGPWEPPEALGRALGALVLSGIVVRTRARFARPALQLFGPGDAIDARELADPESTWRALDHAALAVLDDRFILAARRWPALIRALMRRLFEAQEEQHTIAAITRMPRVEERLLAALCHLADRWGRVTPEGVTLDLPVTHEILGQLIGARRPTVTIALTALKDDELLSRLPDGRWLLPSNCDQWMTGGIPRGRAQDAA